MSLFDVIQKLNCWLNKRKIIHNKKKEKMGGKCGLKRIRFHGEWRSTATSLENRNPATAPRASYEKKGEKLACNQYSFGALREKNEQAVVI